MSAPRHSILVIDDENTLRESIVVFLREEGYHVGGASTSKEALEKLDSEDWDVVITDLRLPDGDGLDIAREVARTSPQSLVLIITAHGNVETVVEALRLGAVDYFLKPINFDDLLLKIGRLVDYRRLGQENAALRRALSIESPPSGFVGDSVKAEEVRRLIELYGPNERIVLVTGESGTGKELVARALHEASSRRSGPFVPVNCAAIPESLLESELFGHRRGAFTGADRDRQGYFEVAASGTLFLDEIAELSEGLQAKLLRVLENGEIYPVGSNRPIRLSAGIIAATNRNLEELIESGGFRSDVYYRLNVLRIDVPPLRERQDDIPILAQHFVDKHRKELRSPVVGVKGDTTRKLQSYRWPGNVRELENVVQRAMILKTGNWLEEDDLPSDIVGDASDAGAVSSGQGKLKTAVREFERQIIHDTLARMGEDKNRAAEELGISLASLYAKLKEGRSN